MKFLKYLGLGVLSSLIPLGLMSVLIGFLSVLFTSLILIFLIKPKDTKVNVYFKSFFVGLLSMLINPVILRENLDFLNISAAFIVIAIFGIWAIILFSFLVAYTHKGI